MSEHRTRVQTTSTHWPVLEEYERVLELWRASTPGVFRLTAAHPDGNFQIAVSTEHIVEVYPSR